MAEHSTVVTSAVRPNEPARQVIATFERDQRDFHSVSGLRPKYYDVVAVRHEHHNMADTPRDATIAGERGYLCIPGPYYQPRYRWFA